VIDQRTPEKMDGGRTRFTGWRGRSPESLGRRWEERWETPLTVLYHPIVADGNTHNVLIQKDKY